MKDCSYNFTQLENQNLQKSMLERRSSNRSEYFQVIIDRLNQKPPNKVLEVGCGLGHRSAQMKNHWNSSEVFGVDLSEVFIQQAKESYSSQVDFKLASVYDLPFEDHSFDFIYSRLVFQHLSDPIQALHELKRILKPGGQILIEDADRDYMKFYPVPTGFDCFWQRVQEGQRRMGGDPNIATKLPSLMQQSGFEEIDVDMFQEFGDYKKVSEVAENLLINLNDYLEEVDRPLGMRIVRELIKAKDKTARYFHTVFYISATPKRI